MNTELRNLSILIALAFLAVIATSFYWSILERDSLQSRPDNPRRIREEQAFERGRIFDRDGRLLADSVQVAEDIRQRVYTDRSVSTALGYYNFRFGAAGLEAAFNDVLAGEIAQSPAIERAINALLHRTEQGHDLRTTLSLSLQTQLFTVMQGRHGAAVLVEVPSGNILASVSVPTFDPGELDAELRAEQSTPDDNDVLAQESPLFNRVQNGRYQPGNVMQLPLLSMLLEDGFELETSVAAQPQLPSTLPETRRLNAGCAQYQVTTLVLAFRSGCTAPYVHLLEGIGYQRFDQAMWRYGFYEPPPLFRGETSTSVPAPPFSEDSTSIYNVVAVGSGQGGITFSPLQSARFVAAVANGGVAPGFVLADAFRLADATEWQLFDIPQASQRLFSSNTAHHIRQAMQTTNEIYLHSGAAYTGEALRLLSWFHGFVYSNPNNQEAIVLVVVLEDAASSSEATSIALPLLATILAE